MFKSGQIGIYFLLVMFCLAGMFFNPKPVQAVEVVTLKGNQSFSAGAEMTSATQRTSDGGYITTSFTQSLLNGSRDIYLYKTDHDGNKEWETTFGGSGDDEGRSVQQTYDGGYVITGYTTSCGAGKRDVILIKTDSEGRRLWQKTYGRSDDEEGNCVVQSGQGFVIIGYTKSVGSGGAEIYVIKTDSLGKRIWEKNYGMYKDDIGRSLLDCSDGYVILGSTRSYGSGNINIYLSKISNDGTQVWTRVLGGDANYLSYFLQRMPNGNYQVLGYVISDSGQRNALILEVDNFGQIASTTVMSEYNSYSDLLKPPGPYGEASGEEKARSTSLPDAPGAKESRIINF